MYQLKLSINKIICIVKMQSNTTDFMGSLLTTLENVNEKTFTDVRESIVQRFPDHNERLTNAINKLLPLIKLFQQHKGSILGYLDNIMQNLMGLKDLFSVNQDQIEKCFESAAQCLDVTIVQQLAQQSIANLPKEVKEILHEYVCCCYKECFACSSTQWR